MIEYRREVDGLRALAVLPVIFFHAGFQAFSGGFVGVDIFFVISGYLITSLILVERQAGTFSLARFYERRARRILPALFFVMLACLPFAWLLLSPADLKRFGQSLVSTSLYGSNILFWLTSGYFEPSGEFKPLLHTWSLAVEEQFYLLFPLAMLIGFRLGMRWLLAILAAAALLSLGAAHWGSQSHPEATFYLLFTRGWELLLGAFVAFYCLHARHRPPPPLVADIAGAAGLALLAYAIFAFDQHTPFPSLYALIPTVGTALLITFATAQTTTGKLLGSKVLVAIGLLSYSAYLWHQPVFSFARHWELEEPGTMLLASLSAIVFLLAYLSWRYIEAPFRDGRRVTRTQVVAYGSAFSVLFIALGLAGHFSGGFLSRYDGQDRYLATMDTYEAREGLKDLSGSIRMKAFDPADARPKVLIIGDSFAEDLINALDASGLMRQMQASFRPVSSTCGNLFLAPARFQQNISPHLQGHCRPQWLFEDARLRALMQAADEIWFAAAWRGWQAFHVQESVAHAQSFAGKPVKVFGTKSFGNVRVKPLLSMAPAERLKFDSPAEEHILEINARLRTALPHGTFVDLQDLMCSPDPASCGLFTPDGDLISYDGGHLTRDGAEFLGSKLAKIKLL